MPHLRFTTALKRFFPDLKPETLPGETVAEVMDHLEQRYPGMRDYLLDERGSLRQHVNVYVEDRLIQDRRTLGDALQASDEVLIFQALSGG
jgi:molybdopterin converting factor small subunit